MNLSLRNYDFFGVSICLIKFAKLKMPQQSETLATFTVNCFVNESFLRVYVPLGKITQK